MSRQPAHPGRNHEILHAIVQEYIETGEPVASRTISRHSREHLSAASVRNVMQDLEEEGFLSQPHASAGRIPTEKGFRSYVQSLNAARILRAELDRIRSEFAQLETLEARVEHTSHLLTEMTRGLGIAVAIPNPSQTLERVDLIALPDRRILMIVATRDHLVHNRVVTVTEPLDQPQLEFIRNYLNHNFAGWELVSVRRELERRLQREAATYDSILAKLNLLYVKGLLDLELNPEIHIEGAANLVGLDLQLTREKLRDLFRALEQKKRVLHLLERFLELPQEEVAIHVGLGDVHPAMQHLALIGLNLHLPSGASAKMAVIGPVRMNYQRAISAVFHVGQAFRWTQV